MVKSFQDHVESLDERYSGSITQATTANRKYGQDIGLMAFQGLQQITSALQALGEQDPNGLMTIVNKIKTELSGIEGGKDIGSDLRAGANRFVAGAKGMSSPTSTGMSNAPEA